MGRCGRQTWRRIGDRHRALDERRTISDEVTAHVKLVFQGQVVLQSGGFPATMRTPLATGSGTGSDERRPRVWSLYRVCIAAGRTLSQC